MLLNYTIARAHKLAKAKLENQNDTLPITPLFICSNSYNNPESIGKYRHKHSFFETHFVFDGSIVYELEDKSKHTVSKGHFIMIMPETQHKVIKFSDKLIKISITFSITSDCKAYVFSDAKSICSTVINQRIINDFNNILEEIDKKDLFSSFIIQSRIKTIILDILRPFEEKQTKLQAIADTDSKDSDRRIEYAKRYINDNNQLFLTCESVAKYCHFNVKYLNRIFKANTGMTLLAYIHERKNEEAKNMLTYTNDPIEKISYSLGFNNAQYFNIFFKRLNGMPPGLYRELTHK